MTSCVEVVLQCNKIQQDISLLYEFWIMDHDSPIGYMLPKFVVQMVWATTGFEVDDLNRTVHLSLKLDAGESVFTACEKEFARLCRLNMTIVNGVKKWALVRAKRKLNDALLATKNADKRGRVRRARLTAEAAREADADERAAMAQLFEAASLKVQIDIANSSSDLRKQTNSTQLQIGQRPWILITGLDKPTTEESLDAMGAVLTSGVNTRWSLRWLLLSLRIVLWRLLLLGRIEPLKRMRDDLMGLEIMLREKHVSLEVPALQERPSCGGGRT
ncbi:hypothetical protein C2857_005318 [Epichloe festucae Fl1]|uniref:Uncharacterized protein n=1 Tax=Epichloe festucae (strain Fl1) TaxID=877507 RepID=A0A7S9KSQ1_EPIFF|nr:hypothetical protein C2857_005318 [Epichloe festucae Fl1]